MRLPLSLLAALALASTGCSPSCERVCEKAIDCDLTALLNQDECVESCTRQKTLYETWEDDEKAEAYAEHRRCVLHATCEELEDDVCYEDELFVF